MARKLKRRGFLTVATIRGKLLAVQLRVFDADHYGLMTLSAHVVRLSLLLEFLEKIDPAFQEFIKKNAARVCAAPDCRRVFRAKWHTNRPGHPKAQKYHSPTCASRHKMQKRRGALAPGGK